MNETVPFQAAQQAMDIKDLSHRSDMLQMQLKNAVESMTSALNNVQLEQRAATMKLDQVVSLQASQDTNKEAIEQIRQGMAEMNSKLEGYFDDVESRHEKRWTRYEEDRDAWRRRHEAENEATKVALSSQIQGSRENLIRIMAWSGGAGALCGVLVVGFIAFLNFRFAVAEAEITDSRDRVREIELYLARGGTHSARPFITPQQQAPKEATHE